MKSQLIAIVAAVLVGCAKAPNISIHRAAKAGDIETVKQHLADGADCVELRGLLLYPQPT